MALPYRPITDLSNEIEQWIRDSTLRFRAQYCVGGKAWVLKYMSPKYIATFLKDKRVVSSNTPGFTWGDGAYVVPIKFPYSTMMYGRAGVMGYLEETTIARAFDSVSNYGIGLYQEWITYHDVLFRNATMTVQPKFANRILRNRFKSDFNIDLVFFRPDQHCQRYVAKRRDQWFVVSENHTGAAHVPTATPAKSNKIRDCEWVVLQYEDFESTSSELHFKELVGKTVRSVPSVHFLPNIEADLHHTYHLNRLSPAGPPHLLYLRP